ncbi:MAG TPA: trypsin-like peptidase domain-containing protein [Ktedonobacterales bacterium]|nr:trypsin-like peptidase domain-containing protein [Ktedonobacterales bacterium]
MSMIDSATLPASAISEELATTAERLRASVVQVRAGRGGIGSGVIWQVAAAEGADPTATVVTNEHVVRAAGESQLTILVADGRVLPAEVFAHDPEHDLALLRVRAADLRPVAAGDSTALRVGELVFAVGNPFGHLNTVTSGIVAARAPLDPEWTLDPARSEAPEAPPTPPRADAESPRQRAGRTPDLIQSHLRLYPGNSGGPLVDARGQVVGINNMIGGGLAFAIPSRIVQQFVASAGAGAGTRPQLGVQVLDVELPDALRIRAGTTAPSAAMIAAVEPASSAEAAGLLPGDIVIGVAGHAIAGTGDLLLALGREPSGAPIALTIIRAGERQELRVTPQLPAAAAA